eukprot:TRINITY_DN5218_c0_g1_i1.p1 TRINITY_DN5218_c0_g1~~TRINITY_DN5218_c0_g1_i1.p1  ORF type:complete len:412 (+),score=87.83 TRINITY_DN5218_c0_g1_i1:94-1329(+)
MAYQEANQAQPGMKNLLRQTRLCKFNLSGRCLLGSSCNFAHDQRDLKVMPNLQKTRLCTNFLALGSCKFGSSCTYAHSTEELRNSDGGVQEQREAQKSSTIAALQPTCGLPGAKKDASSDVQCNAKPSARTSMCQFYLDGACKRGSACSFAHGEDELRPKPDLFKTGYCLRFMTSGKCRHGQGCRFAHGVQELRSSGAPQDLEASKGKTAHVTIENSHTAKGGSQKILDPVLRARLSEDYSEVLQHVYLRLCLQTAKQDLAHKLVALGKTAQAGNNLTCESSKDSEVQQSAGSFSRQTTAASTSAPQHEITLTEKSLASLPEMSSVGPASMDTLPLLEEESDDDDDDESLANAAPAESSPSRFAVSPHFSVSVKNTFLHVENPEEDCAAKELGCRVRSSSSPASLKRMAEH